MFHLTDFKPSDIYDDIDFYTHLHFKRENIMGINDLLGAFQHEPDLNSAVCITPCCACQMKSVIINKCNFFSFSLVILSVFTFFSLFIMITYKNFFVC